MDKLPRVPKRFQSLPRVSSRFQRSVSTHPNAYQRSAQRLFVSSRLNQFPHGFESFSEIFKYAHVFTRFHLFRHFPFAPTILHKLPCSPTLFHRPPFFPRASTLIYRFPRAPDFFHKFPSALSISPHASSYFDASPRAPKCCRRFGTFQRDSTISHSSSCASTSFVAT